MNYVKSPSPRGDVEMVNRAGEISAGWAVIAIWGFLRFKITAGPHLRPGCDFKARRNKMDPLFVTQRLNWVKLCGFVCRIVAEKHADCHRKPDRD